MLRDGQFIKEEPPKIGAYYTPTTSPQFSKEEQFMQSVLLGATRHETFLSRFFGFMLRV